MLSEQSVWKFDCAGGNSPVAFECVPVDGLSSPRLPTTCRLLGRVFAVCASSSPLGMVVLFNGHKRVFQATFLLPQAGSLFPGRLPNPTVLQAH